MSRTELNINENTSAPVTTTLIAKDEDGTEFALTTDMVDSIEMTLIETRSGEVINDRQKQDVLGQNDCELHATSGLFTWNVQPEDTAIVNNGTQVGQRENHLATITVTWDTDKQMHFEILLMVKNLRSVPQVAP